MFDKVSTSMSKMGIIDPQPILGLMSPADLKAVTVASDLHSFH